jgi:AraC-like DNA-binding protein
VRGQIQHIDVVDGLSVVLCRYGRQAAPHSAAILVGVKAALLHTVEICISEAMLASLAAGCGGELRPLVERLARSPVLPIPAGAAYLVQDIVGTASRPPPHRPGWGLSVQALVLALLARMLPDDQPILAAPVEMQVRDLLYDNLLAPPSLNELALRYGLSVRTLNERFRQRHGQTVAEWLVERRLTYAHDQLALTDIPIKELSVRLGFRHQSNFTNAFTNHFGFPPSRVRTDQAQETTQ